MGITIDMIKHRFGDHNENGYVYCSFCPKPLEICSTEDCDGREEAYEHIKRYFDEHPDMIGEYFPEYGKCDTCEIEKCDETPSNLVEKCDDPVNHPSHYTDGKIEVIDFIEDKQLGFHLGNAIKYISRAGKKNPDKTIEDLNKAIWYIERYIKLLNEVV